MVRITLVTSLAFAFLTATATAGTSLQIGPNTSGHHQPKPAPLAESAPTEKITTVPLFPRKPGPISSLFPGVFDDDTNPEENLDPEVHLSEDE